MWNYIFTKETIFLNYELFAGLFGFVSSSAVLVVRVQCCGGCTNLRAVFFPRP